MSRTHFANASLIDGVGAEAIEGQHVLVENGLIVEVSDRPISATDCQVVDLSGKYLMPGLIDAHVHVVAGSVDLGLNARLPNSLVAARSAHILNGMLRRGFTSVRDLGGADHGLQMALAEGSMVGPRLVICGKALSQTGGHTDYRGRFDMWDGGYFTNRLGALGRIVDGVDAVRHAAREEIRAGANFIKVMANGGVSSPTDPIAFMGFSRAELLAAVEEAQSAQTYVAAHLYTDEAIIRALECGVTSIEHANLITAPTARLLAAKGAFVVPTLVTYERLKIDGSSMGLPQASIDKVDDVRKAGLASLEILRSAGAQIVFGTDLLGDMHPHQSDEFAIRAEVIPADELIASATSVAARLLGMEGRVGCIAVGAHADMIVLNRNPLLDARILSRPDVEFAMVVKDGVVVER